MKYALTITSDPNAYDWGDTDTILFEYASDALPEKDTDVMKLIEQVIKVYNSELAERMDVADTFRNGWYILRNCNDTDVTIEREI